MKTQLLNTTVHGKRVDFLATRTETNCKDIYAMEKGFSLSKG